jgi:hypothetical protein
MYKTKYVSKFKCNSAGSKALQNKKLKVTGEVI